MGLIQYFLSTSQSVVDLASLPIVHRHIIGELGKQLKHNPLNMTPYKHLQIAILMRNHRSIRDVVIKQVILSTVDEMTFVFYNVNFLYLNKTMSLQLPQRALGINSLMKNDSLFSVRICGRLYLPIDVIAYYLYVILADVTDQVLFEGPLNVLVKALKELTLTNHQILRHFWEDKFIIEKAS